MRKKRKSETEVTFRIQTNPRSTRFTGRTRSARATKRETFVSETRRAVVQTIPVCTYGRLPRLYDRTLHGEARHAPRVASLPTASPTRETSTRVESRASRRARRWIAATEKKRDARLLRRVVETWRRARVASARREVPVVRAWQKRIDRASACRAAAESMRSRRQRARLVHGSFFAWRKVVTRARVFSTRLRAAVSVSRRVALRAAFEAWRARVLRLRRAVAAGDFKRRARETAPSPGRAACGSGPRASWCGRPARVKRADR